MECFCMFVAALCHEMEYRDSVSPFMPASGCTLASLYSSPGSVVQFHSIAQTIRLFGECGITDDFNLEKFKELVSLLDEMILGMDLANHIYSRNEVKKLLEEKKILRPAKNRKHYFGLLLTCCDLSDFCKPWEYLEGQGMKVSEEFFMKDKTAECQGLIDFGELFENVQLKKVILQIHFIQAICEPAFSLLSSALPRTDRCMETIEFNTRKLLANKEKVIQAQMEQF